MLGGHLAKSGVCSPQTWTQSWPLLLPGCGSRARCQPFLNFTFLLGKRLVIAAFWGGVALG